MFSGWAQGVVARRSTGYDAVYCGGCHGAPDHCCRQGRQYWLCGGDSCVCLCVQLLFQLGVSVVSKSGIYINSVLSTHRPVAWVVTSEIFPLSIRGLAVSLTTSSNWIGNFIIAMVTPILLGSFLGTGGTFFILGGLLFASFLFVLLTLPETKVRAMNKLEIDIAPIYKGRKS